MSRKTWLVFGVLIIITIMLLLDYVMVSTKEDHIFRELPEPHYHLPGPIQTEYSLFADPPSQIDPDYEINQILTINPPDTEQEQINVETQSTQEYEQPYIEFQSNIVVPNNPNCNIGFDETFVGNLRNNNVSVCINQEPDSLLNTCIYHTKSEVFCTFQNLILDKSKLFIDYKPNVHKPEPILAIPVESLDVTCEINLESYREIQEKTTVEPAHRVFAAINAVFQPQVERLDPKLCEGKWIDHYLYFFERVAGVNTYHNTMDLYSFWFTLRLYNIPISQVQIVYFDGLHFKHTDTMFERLTNYPGVRFGNITSDPDKSYLCARKAIFGASGYAIYPFDILVSGALSSSLLCTYSSLWVEFREYILFRVGVSALNSFVLGANPTITFIVRRDFFRSNYHSEIVTRKFYEEEKVLEKLSELTDVNIFWVDFADYTWEEQIRLIRTTDLLVGVHGAGLTQLIFLNDNSSVLEVVPSSYSARRHFRALSAYLGHQYYSVMASFVRGEDFVRLDDSFYSTLNDAISDVRSRKCMKNYQYCQSVTRDQPAIINPPW